MVEKIKKNIYDIYKGVIPNGYVKTKIGIMPEKWNIVRLREISKHKTKKNMDMIYTETYTNSATKGIIMQTEYFDKKISNDENISNYFIVEKNDYVYNPRISVSAPCGPISKSHLEQTGIMSPLYTVFRLNDEYKNNDYIEYYFKSSLWHRYMKSVANYGVRHDRMNITNDDLFNMPIPFPPLEEQQKIAEILSTQDKVIELKEKLIKEKQRQKKYLMQQLLTGKMRLKGYSWNWKKTRLSDVLKERNEKKNEQLLRICSVAVKKGVIDQIEHLGRSYAANDTSNYNVVHYGDIVYTKSPTGDFPYGIIKQNHLKENVAVSPLYGVFEPISYSLGYLLHVYFDNAINTRNYLFPIIQKGAKNTINISNEVFLSKYLYLPLDRKEEDALANIFISADKELELLQNDLEQEKQKKKALMQLLLTGIVRVKL